MSKTEYRAVIGKNFGDEGKGLATDFLCDKAYKNLVVRANGGAQSGHTVETKTKRFVFHELSSGSFKKADTYWADTYHPDLYKLSEEVNDFKEVSGFTPRIFSHKDAGITTILDVLLNMAFEKARGDNRHGSCAMGIYETELREKAGLKITLGDLSSLGVKGLCDKLFEIKDNYIPKRIEEENLSDGIPKEYSDLLNDRNVLINFSKIVFENFNLVKVIDKEKAFFNEYDQVIFENGQGLLLDSECERFYPNVSGSRTGLTNIEKILSRNNEKLSEVVYVSRSYVTRHGAGYLPTECRSEEISGLTKDNTNLPNEWQGSLRYAFHESIDEFVKPVEGDLKALDYRPKVSLLLTHLNETKETVMIKDRSLKVDEFINQKEILKTFDKVYLSEDKYAENIKG